MEQLEWPADVQLANGLEAISERSGPWDADLARVRDLIGRALEKPSEPGLQVDYLFATIRAFDPPLTAEDVLSRLDLVPLLTGDTRTLSERSRHDASSHAHSYYADDLVVIDSSRALIVEPGPEADVADVLAVAHAQLLELWYTTSGSTPSSLGCTTGSRRREKPSPASLAVAMRRSRGRCTRCSRR